MSSGQKNMLINTNERPLSTDINRLQAFIAQERNDIIRALVQRSYSNYEQPGVAIVASGAAATPLAATVIDGLDMNVDNAGSVLINPGVLVAWVGTPAGADDTGFEVIVDVGIQSLGQLVIAANGGGSPRCVVIECSVQSTIVEGNVSRDIRNPSTGIFAPTNVTKVTKDTLLYRVRQGTPGSPPGYVAGWLPIGLAVIQPGAALNNVDFYDVRPLHRELGASLPQYDSFFSHPIVPNSRNSVTVTGTNPFTNSDFSGQASMTIDGAKFGGPLYRNSPIAATNLANFGTTTAGVGGDDAAIRLSAENALRGASFAGFVTAKDLIVLAAWLPDLGGSVPLPRCVRYCQHIQASPTTPSRRRPYGPNGILLVTNLAEDGQIAPNGAFSNIPLLATGIGGCLGNGNGVPLAMARVQPDGVTLASSTTGFAEGMGTDANYRPVVANRTIISGSMTYSGGIDSTVITSATPVAIPNANFTIPVVAGDRLEMHFGCLVGIGNSSVSAELLIQITEDVAVSSTPTPLDTIVLIDANPHYLAHNWTYPVTKTGNLQVRLYVQSDVSHTVRVYSPTDHWGSYDLVRPL